jgi:hypothetical protein
MKVHVENIENGDTFTVLLDNEDISNRCYAFDTIEGWVDTYEADSDGKLKLVVIGEKNGWLEKDLVRKRLFGVVSATKDEKEEQTAKNE